MQNAYVRAVQCEEKQLCLKIAGDIVVSAIQADKLSANADEICEFFSTVYKGIIQAVAK